MKFEICDLVKVKYDERLKYRDEKVKGLCGVIIGCGNSDDSYMIYFPYFDKGHTYFANSEDEKLAHNLYKILSYSFAEEECCWFVNEEYLNLVYRSNKMDRANKITEIKDILTGKINQTINDVDYIFEEDIEEEIVEQEEKNIHMHPVIKAFDDIFHKVLLGGKER